MHKHRFTVPAADRIANPATDTDAADVQQRVTHLPYADPASVADALIKALTLLNRHPERINARADIMAAYRVPCARLMRSVPDKPGAPSSDAMRQLMTEMAYGYKHLINDALSQHSWLKSRKKLSQSLYFGAKYLSLEMFLAFEAYRCQISNSWREILAVYRLAEQQNLHLTPAEDRDQPVPGNATVSHALKRILLLKLQDPCRMMPGEARACFGFINELASQAELENLAAMRNPAGRYLLDLDGAEPPKPPDPDTLPQNPDRFRYLNLLPISRTLQALSFDSHGGAEGNPGDLSHVPGLEPQQIIKRMLKAWHVSAERRSEREESFGWMLCGCGLAAVNHFLGGPIDDPGDDEEVDMQNPSTLAGHPTHYEQVRCRQVNRSSGGMCLRVQIPNSPDPRVGQVLMMREDKPDGSGQWYAGIVRRLLRVDADTLEAGIQFIRGTIRPIQVKVKGEGSQGQFQPGIWVDRGDPRISSILVTHGLYQRGREFVLQSNGPAAAIRADQLVESTPGFQRFRFLLD